MVEEDGVDRLAVVQAVLAEVVAGVAQGREMAAVEARHGGEVVVVDQLEHVFGEVAAVHLVARLETETAAQDVAAGPGVVVEDGDAHRPSGQVGDGEAVLARPAVQQR